MTDSPLRAALEAEGWWIRVTRWEKGWQVGAYWPSHPQRWNVTSEWCKTEYDAWTALGPLIDAVRENPEWPPKKKRLAEINATEDDA